MNTVESIKRTKLIAILRGVSVQDIQPVAKALYNGGIRWLEVTFDQTTDGRETTESIGKVLALGLEGLQVGAGTVMNTRQVLATKNAGGMFVVSPNSDPDVIVETKKQGMLSLPGAMTPTEISECHACGADIVKVFPCGVLGPSYIKAILDPLKHIPVAAVGGISAENAKSFLDAGACCVGVGSSLTPKDVIRNKEFTKLTDLARSFTSALR